MQPNLVIVHSFGTGVAAEMAKSALEAAGIAATIQATPRFSCTLNVPVLFASRRANNAYSTQTSLGIGDTNIVAQAWISNPRRSRARRGNLGYRLWPLCAPRTR
jgi:hypothetical protein